MTLRLSVLLAVTLVMAVAVAWVWWSRKAPDAAQITQAYATPLPAPDGPLRVFHLGHSLVGRDMPAMVGQLAEAGVGPGHGYESQLGWGTSLREHYEPGLAINGFDTENDHPRYRDAREALASGNYDAVVLTEMVELRDAIRYHKSGAYLPKWADLARAGGPETRVYLYETWHKLDDPEGWLTRLDLDLGRYWKAELLWKDLHQSGDRPVYLIPAGQVMARLVRAVEAQGGVGNMASREDLFARSAEGELDQIHINDLGVYLVALTHYAVLYHRSPVGLPHDLSRADGSAADAPDPILAQVMQEVVWEVVRSMPETGVAVQ